MARYQIKVEEIQTRIFVFDATDYFHAERMYLNGDEPAMIIDEGLSKREVGPALFRDEKDVK